MAWIVLTLVFLLSGVPPGGHVIDDALDGSRDGVPGAPTPSTPLEAADIGGITAGAALFGLFLTTLLAAGTKHVTRDNVLEHHTRRKMYEFLWETGSAHLRRISTALDLSTTNATWHLDKLVKAGLVGEVKANGYRMYYPKGAGRILRDQCVLSAQVQSDNAQAVVDFVRDNPGSHQREIARALGVNHGTARWHLSKLTEAGVLEAVRNGRTTSYELTDHAKDVLTADPVGPRSPIGQSA